MLPTWLFCYGYIYVLVYLWQCSVCKIIDKIRRISDSTKRCEAEKRSNTLCIIINKALKFVNHFSGIKKHSRKCQNREDTDCNVPFLILISSSFSYSLVQFENIFLKGYPFAVKITVR